MRVLHLYSNYKWTGPAELALLLAKGLVGGELPSGEPLEPAFAIAGFVPSGTEPALARRAAQLELPLRNGLELRRHFHPASFMRDAKRLAEWIDAGQVDLLHCHQPGDHLVAALAVGLASRRAPIVRSLWEGAAPKLTPRARLAYGRTALVTAPFASLVEPLRAVFDLPAQRVRSMAPPIAPEFWAPADSCTARAALRAELGIGAQAPLVGIAARIQRRRRWDLLWRVFRHVTERVEGAHLAVLGRPDEGVFDEVCARPLAALGVRDRVHFLGYRRDAGYRDALRALDVFVFLVPGSDATCRAVREAMAVGVACLTTDLGHLGTIVGNGRTGLVRPARADALAGAVVELLRVPDLRRRLGAAAREHAASAWAPGVAAEQALAAYGCAESFQ